MFLPIPEEVLDDLLADKKQEEDNALKEVIEKKEKADTKKNVVAQKRIFFWGYERERLLQLHSILTKKAKDFFLTTREIVFDHSLSVAGELLKNEMVDIQKYLSDEEEEEEEQEKSFLKGFTNLYRITKLLAITRNAIESFTKSIRAIHDIASKYTIKDLFESKQKREEFINELKSRWADILDPVFFGIKLSILTAIEDIFSVILPFISGVANALLRAGVAVVKGVKFLAGISYSGVRRILVGIRETALYRNMASKLGKTYIVAGTRTAIQRFGAAFSGVRTALTRVGESTTVRVAGNVLGAMGTGLKIAGRAAGIGFNYGAGFFIDVALGHSITSALQRNKFSLAVGGVAGGLMVAGVGMSATVAGVPLGVVLMAAGFVAGIADTVSNLADEAKAAYRMGMQMLKGIMNAIDAVTIKSRVEGATIYEQYYSGLYNQIGFNRYLSMLKEEGGIAGNYYNQLYRIVEWVRDHLIVVFDSTGLQEYKSAITDGMTQLKTNLSNLLSTMKFEINIESTVDWIIKTVSRVRETYSYKGKLEVYSAKQKDGSTSYRFSYNGRVISVEDDSLKGHMRRFLHGGQINVQPEQNLDIFGGEAFEKKPSGFFGNFISSFKFGKKKSFNDYQDEKIEKMKEKTKLLDIWATLMEETNQNLQKIV